MSWANADEVGYALTQFRSFNWPTHKIAIELKSKIHLVCEPILVVRVKLEAILVFHNTGIVSVQQYTSDLFFQIHLLFCSAGSNIQFVERSDLLKLPS